MGRKPCRALVSKDCLRLHVWDSKESTLMGLVIARIVCTCPFVPAQWDAWTTSGQYLYLRYRFGRGTVDAYGSPDHTKWTVPPDGLIAAFRDEDQPYGAEIELEDFLERAGLSLAPDAVVISYARYRSMMREAVRE